MAYLVSNVGLHASAQPTDNTFTASKELRPMHYEFYEIPSYTIKKQYYVIGIQ